MEFPLLKEDMREEQSLRVEKVREAMRAQGADAMLAASSVNIFYLTGGVCRGYYYIPAEGEPLFFVMPPAEPNYPGMVAVRKPEQIAALLGEKGYPMPTLMGLEFEDLYYSEVERLKNAFPGVATCDGSRIMRTARMVKTPREIEAMREDGKKHCAVYSRIAGLYVEGMTDLELQIEIERVQRREGCLGYLRAAGSKMEINMGSLIAGPNADVPTPYDFSMGGGGTDPSLPVGASGLIMKPGMSVMVDMNGGFNGYQTDMTRCWTIGEPTPEAVKAHECSRAILRDLEEFGKVGAPIGEMYRRAAAIAADAGLSDYFMGHKRHVAFIGHGVGIELNEGPVIMERNKACLEENMTIALEPKFVLPGVGALGVENTYVVTATGLQNLTPFPEELKSI